MEQVVLSYLKYLKIPISPKYCKKRIASHSDYPSVLSVADTLERFGIEYQIARIEEEELGQVQFPYMIHVEKDGGEFLLLKNQTDLESRQEDLKFWKGVVLKVNPKEEIADPENQKAFEEERFYSVIKSVLITSITGLLLFSLTQFLFWDYLALLLTALAGTVIGYLLVAKDLGIRYQAVESFCNAGNLSSCDKILLSGDAKLFGRITFSDVMMSYFCLQLVVLGFLLPSYGSPTSWLGVLTLLSTATIPVVIYSLYYQGLKVKTWCRLCLIVDTLLVVQAGLFGYFLYAGALTAVGGSWITMGIVGLLFLSIGSFLLLLKHTIDNKNRAESAEVSALRVKTSPELFYDLLQKQRRVKVTPFDNELQIGNPEASVRLVMAANLYCAPCKSKLEEIVQLLSVFPDCVNASIRLLKSGGDDGWSSGYLLRYWLEAIEGEPNEREKSRRLLQDWYSLMNIEKYMETYSLPNRQRTPALEECETRHYKWIKEAKITRTPTIFLNGYEFPNHYSVKDLADLIPGLMNKLAKIKSENEVPNVKKMVK